MLAPWIMEEMRTVDLKDRRLDKRLCEVLAQLAAHPTASIPAACGGRAEMEAAYRLFDNDNVTFDNILQSHQAATRRRMAGQAVVVFAQDTTEIDLTRPEQQVAGAGPLTEGNRVGALLHVLHAFTPDGHTRWELCMRRPGRATMPRHGGRHSRMRNVSRHPWKTRKVTVGLSPCGGLARKQSARPNARMACVADSEADIYELMAEGMSEPRTAEWIVRACQNRALHTENAAEDAGPRVSSPAASGSASVVHQNHQCPWP